MAYFIAFSLGKAIWSTPDVDTYTSGSGYVNYKSKTTLNKDNLPAGYTWSDNNPEKIIEASIFVNVRDNTKLQTALDAAYELLGKTTDSEIEALANDKIYLRPSNKTEVSFGVKYGVKYIEAETASKLKQLLDTVTDSSGQTTTQADQYRLKESQKAVNELAEQITDAATTLKTALDKPDTGADYTDVNILANVKAWLDRLKLVGDCAFSDDYQPLTKEKYDDNEYKYFLPVYATSIQINADGDTDTIYLEWSIDDTTYATPYHNTQASGNWYVRVTGVPTTPQTITLTATAENYGVVGTFNCIIGAPIAIDTDKVEAIDLPSGSDQEFTVNIPLIRMASQLTQNTTLKIAEIDAEKITATRSGDALTSDVSVISANPDENNPDGDCTILPITLKATTKEFQPLVVLVAPKDTSPAPATGTVTITIPSGALKLTEAAKKEGWYIPENGLTLTVGVKVCPPADGYKNGV